MRVAGTSITVMIRSDLRERLRSRVASWLPSAKIAADTAGLIMKIALPIIQVT
jgi:hypothetical protein